MENKDKDITWMVDCVIILLFTFCLFCSSCEDSFTETTSENEMLSSSQTDSLIAETWGVDSKQVTMVNVLLNNALQFLHLFFYFKQKDRHNYPYNMETEVLKLRF